MSTLKTQMQSLTTISQSSRIFIGHLKRSHQNVRRMMSKSCQKPVKTAVKGQPYGDVPLSRFQ